MTRDDEGYSGLTKNDTNYWDDQGLLQMIEITGMTRDEWDD